MSKTIAHFSYHRKASISHEFMVRSHALLIKVFKPSAEGATFGTSCRCSNWSLNAFGYYLHQFLYSIFRGPEKCQLMSTFGFDSASNGAYKCIWRNDTQKHAFQGPNRTEKSFLHYCMWFWHDMLFWVCTLIEWTLIVAKDKMST